MATINTMYEHSLSDIDDCIAEAFDSDTDSLVALSDLSEDESELDYPEPINMGPVAQKYIQEKETEAKEATDACVKLEARVDELESQVFDQEQTIDCRDYEVEELKKQIRELQDVNPPESQEVRCDNCLDCIDRRHNFSEMVYWCNNHTAITKHYCLECDPHGAQRVNKLLDWYAEIDEDIHDDRTVFRMFYRNDPMMKKYTLRELKDWKSGIAAPAAAPAPAPVSRKRKFESDETDSEPESEPETNMQSNPQPIRPKTWRRRVTTTKPKWSFKNNAYENCPWCPYRGDAQKRSLLEHMCSKSKTCAVPQDQRVHAKVVNNTSFALVGQSGYEALKNLGFEDPNNFINEYIDRYGGHCPHCDFTCISSRKISRHIKSKHKDIVNTV